MLDLHEFHKTLLVFLPTPDRGLQPQRSHYVLGSHRDGSPQQPRERALPDTRFLLEGWPSLHTGHPTRGRSQDTNQQAPFHWTTVHLDVSADFRQLLAMPGARAA